MRKWTAFLAALLFAVMGWLALTPLAQGADTPRKRKPQPRPQAEAATLAELTELVRRAEQAAAAAQAEARRAREQAEAMQQQLTQTAKELSALRQSLAKPSPQAIAGVAPLQGNQRNPQPEREATTISESTPQSVSATQPLADRVATLEEQVDINTAQIKEHAQTKVESDSRFRVKLSGMILVNTFLNSDDSSVRSTPTRAPSAADALGQVGRNVGANLRQTLIGLTMEGPRLAGAHLSAETEFDFYGTNGDTFRGNPLGTLRLRTASARLDWERTSLTVGLRPVMFSPLNPSSLAMVWYPAMSNAGNLWQWRPQIILEHRPQLTDSSELVLQGGLLTPFGETLDSLPIEGGPSYQGRVAYRHRYDSEKKLEIGVGGEAGQRKFILNRSETTYVISSDWLVPVASRLELSGEAYFGKANNFSEQSGLRADAYYALTGPIDNPATVIRGVHTFGGWAQMKLKVRRDLDFNLALGIEDPRNRDVFADRRNLNNYFKNQVFSANFIYQLRQNLLLSTEYRRLWTDYATGRRRNGHYNFSIGYLF